MSIFLKAKHWQIFLLTFGLQNLLQQYIMQNAVPQPQFGGTPEIVDPMDIFQSFMAYVPYLLLLGVVIGLIVMGWQWSITVGLQDKMPEEEKIPLKRFKIVFFVLVLLSFVPLIAVITYSAGMVSFEYSLEGFLNLFLMFLPLFLLGMFCSIHTYYYAAKTVKAVELQRKLKFSDFAGELFLIWFYFIGVWIIQPKVNRMVEEEELIIGE